MYREMRRKDRETSKEDAIKLLQSGEYGVLATVDGSGMPYAVPVNYAYMDGSIYFHCAKEGYKLDNIRSNEKISFCVVGATNVLADKFSTAYESTIVFGKASIIEDAEEKNKALFALIEKYSADFMQAGTEYINRAAASTCVVKLSIDHVTGKQRSQ